MAESKLSPTISAPFRIIVLLSGRGSNLRALLTGMSDLNQAVEIVAVLSDKPHAAGLDIARAAKIPTQVIERKLRERSNEQFNAELASVAESYQPDLIVLAGFMRVLTTEFVGAFQGKIINIHPSLLPSFRGLHAQQQAIDAGVRFAGCSVHLVVNEVDAGAIIAQAVVPVFSDDTAESLAARILRQEHQLLPTVVRGIALGEIELAVQTDQSVKVISMLKSGLTEDSSLISLS